jgi:hypothetical protein
MSDSCRLWKPSLVVWKPRKKDCAKPKKMTVDIAM